MLNDLKTNSMNTMGNMENCNKTTKCNFQTQKAEMHNSLDELSRRLHTMEEEISELKNVPQKEKKKVQTETQKEKAGKINK